jgi:hypothetical protein
MARSTPFCCAAVDPNSANTPIESFEAISVDPLSTPLPDSSKTHFLQAQRAEQAKRQETLRKQRRTAGGENLCKNSVHSLSAMAILSQSCSLPNLKLAVRRGATAGSRRGFVP